VDAASSNKTRQNKKLEYSGRLAGKTAGDEIASWRMIASHVQEATGRKLAAAIVSVNPTTFCAIGAERCQTWPGTQIEGVTDLSESEMKA